MGSETKGTPDVQKAKVPEIKFTKLFINGEFVDSISGKNIVLCLSRREREREIGRSKSPRVRSLKKGGLTSGKTFETRDPRTGHLLAKVAEGDKEDVDLAVKAARDAFDHGKWPRLPGSVTPLLTIFFFFFFRKEMISVESRKGGE